MAHLLVAITEHISLLSTLARPHTLLDTWRGNLVFTSLSDSETWPRTKAQADDSLDCAMYIFSLL